MWHSVKISPFNLRVSPWEQHLNILKKHFGEEEGKGDGEEEKEEGEGEGGARDRANSSKQVLLNSSSSKISTSSSSKVPVLHLSSLTSSKKTEKITEKNTEVNPRNFFAEKNGAIPNTSKNLLFQPIAFHCLQHFLDVFTAFNYDEKIAEKGESEGIWENNFSDSEDNFDCGNVLVLIGPSGVGRTTVRTKNYLQVSFCYFPSKFRIPTLEFHRITRSFFRWPNYWPKIFAIIISFR